MAPPPLPQGEVCHNDTTICVCADKNCNSDKYSSAAPPYTPGSGLVCYVEDEHHHGPHDRWEGDSRRGTG